MKKPVNPPIVQSTIYQFDTNQEMRETMLSGDPHFYMRSGNPTVQSVAEEISALEGSEASLLFASGMAAISCTLLSFLRSGDHMICHHQVFSQTRSFMETVLTKFGVSITFADLNETHSLLDSMNANTKVVYVETPSNPMLDIVDIARVARNTASKSLLLVDSTNATPVLQQPLKLGASLVFHSGTKYLSGHSDVLCGVVSGSKALAAEIHRIQKLTGGVLDPHAAYLFHRGLKTLSLRMNQICESALRVAQFLSSRPEIAIVRYPFLEADPGYAVAKLQMRGGGGLISFDLKSGLGGAKRFVDSLKIIQLATSLGGIQSTIEIPYELKRIRDDVEPEMNLIRLSIGIEDVGVLLKDLDQALKTTNSR